MTIFAWLILDLLIVSFVEYAAHRWLLHRRILDAFWFPHTLHHKRYYRVFNHESDPIGRELNLRIRWRDTAYALLLTSPLFFLSPTGYAILFALAWLQRWGWNAIHAEMHLHENRCFARLRIYQALAKYHFLHHQHPDRNFNVTLPLFDALLKTRARATAADERKWSALEAGGQDQ